MPGFVRLGETDAEQVGHVVPAGTYWYLTGTPELLALAAARLDQQGEPR